MRCTRPEQLEYHKGGKLVPCGYCPACKYNQRVGWTFRISEHARHSKEAWFITLTYDQENIPLLDYETGELVRGMDKNRSDMCESLDASDLRRFLTSVKKAQVRAYKEVMENTLSPSEVVQKPELKYFAVSEYGGKLGRPHYHIIIFNLWSDLAREDRLLKIWKKGKVETEALNPALIHYATGYLFEKNKYLKGRQQKPKMWVSKGLGEQYVKRNKKFHKDNLNPWIWFNGYKIAMPQYYKEKIFTLEEIETINAKLMEHHSESDKIEITNHYTDRKQSEYSINSRNKKRK